LNTKNLSLTKNNTVNTKAVAVRYSSIDAIPSIVANGLGEIAKKILKIAEENSIPIVQDDFLSNVLSKLKEGTPLPEETFEIMAEIIIFLYNSDKEWASEHTFLDGVITPPAKI
jgi:flagellar biosynthesis protein